MIDFRARLPKEEAAMLLAAIEAAKDQFGPPPAKPDPCGEESKASPDASRYSNADALVDVARVFLNTAPEDRSGEDRTLVVVQVSAENLARSVPAGTPGARPAGVDPVRTFPRERSHRSRRSVTLMGSARSSRRPHKDWPARVRCLVR